MILKLEIGIWKIFVGVGVGRRDGTEETLRAKKRDFIYNK